MEVVLGVSMAPTAVRMVLVEGDRADGVTVDHETVAVPAGTDAARLAEQVAAAIEGTRDGAADEAHRLVSVGVAWSDHFVAAALRDELRERRLDDVVMVSELHAAGALAQAVGRRTGCEHIALVFLEGRLLTLAVVRTADGAVVAVSSRSLLGVDDATELAALVTGLEDTALPPQAVFIIGSGVDVEALRTGLAHRTGLPVHAPEDGELALARGAALAAAHAPRFDAATVGLDSADEPLTAAESTQMAAAGYVGSSAYSAVLDDGEITGFVPDLPGPAHDEGGESEPFLLVGSALASIFVVGMVALVISLAVTIRPTVDQRPDPGRTATAPPSTQVSGAPAPETIRAPVPVVQQAPRTVVVAPPASVRVAAPVPEAPAPLPPANTPAAPAAPPVVPAPVVAAPVVPAPVMQFPILPPIVVPPILPRLLPSIPVAPNPMVPRPVAPATPTPSTSTSTVTTTATAVLPAPPAPTSAPSTAPASTPAASAPAASTSVVSTPAQSAPASTPPSSTPPSSTPPASASPASTSPPAAEPAAGTTAETTTLWPLPSTPGR